jgi:hypothetical protein
MAATLPGSSELGDQSVEHVDDLSAECDRQL